MDSPRPLGLVCRSKLAPMGTVWGNTTLSDVISDIIFHFNCLRHQQSNSFDFNYQLPGHQQSTVPDTCWSTGNFQLRNST